MIKVFGKTDKLFSSNGDVVLHPLKARVHKEDNGPFYLDIDAGLEYVDYLVEGNIIVANLPQGDQAFRVTNPRKTRSKVSVRANHVFFDSKNYLIANSYVVDKTCDLALYQLNNATEPASEFSMASDIQGTNSFWCIRNSLYEAIQTVLKRWGGHLVRDNFRIEIRNSIGEDNGVTVRYKKNLREITCEENWDAVVTKLLPVGKDGLTLPEVYVESATQYPIPYTKTVSFSQDGVSEDDYKDADGNLDEAAYTQALIDDLRQQANEYVDVNSVPKISYTLNANLERITDIGDTVSVIDERLGIDVLTNVSAFEYDCILKKYTQLEFGNFRKTISCLVSNINANTQSIVEERTNAVSGELKTDIQNATNEIKSVMRDSFVIYDGDSILVLDRLPKENAEHVLLIDHSGVSYSQTGISGPFASVWSIGGTIDFQELNVINLNRSVITRSLSAVLSNLIANAYTIIPLDLSRVTGGRFSATNDGGIRVGSGVDKVIVSASISFDTVNSTDDRHIRIVKNSIATNNTLAIVWRTLTQGQSDVLETSPILADVQEGDVIYLLYYTGDSMDRIGGNTYGCRTSLTVQEVE